MNTVMQELIEWIEKGGAMNDYPRSSIMKKATELLAKEKDLIKSAFNAGYDEGISEHDKYEDAGDYFNQTYATTN